MKQICGNPQCPHCASILKSVEAGETISILPQHMRDSHRAYGPVTFTSIQKPVEDTAYKRELALIFLDKVLEAENIRGSDDEIEDIRDDAKEKPGLVQIYTTEFMKLIE